MRTELSGLSGIKRVPVTRHIRLLPRIGAFYYSSDTDVTASTDRYSSDNDSFGGTMGFGGGYAFDNGLMLSLVVHPCDPFGC